MPLKKDDLVVITGPLIISGCTVEGSFIDLAPGEVARVLAVGEPDELGQDALVIGLGSGVNNHIAASSLTPLSEVQGDPEVGWGDLLDPNYVHDFVGEEAADV